VVLPAEYVADHVELGYATTAYRAQGRTVDTAHALISPGATRESLYVAATRARQANTLYVDTTNDPDIETSHDEVEQRDAPAVLSAVLQRTADSAAAHSAMELERQDHAEAEPWTASFATSNSYAIYDDRAQRDVSL
jgi:ATP-dependent exoDNAse (exonuclease V) alpha subunit